MDRRRNRADVHIDRILIVPQIPDNTACDRDEESTPVASLLGVVERQGLKTVRRQQQVEFAFDLGSQGPVVRRCRTRWA